MKKMIFKYFIYNTLAVILLYGLYVILLLQSPDIKGMANEQTYFFILTLLRNSFLSFYFIPVLIMLAVTYFFNLFQSIRKSSFLSFMTFAAIPLLLCLYSCFVALMLPINPFN
ncbi:MAG: hypothetical protein MUE53_06260, partial [Chitinophagales bacterium]|nr:hypothetical protein [Chitinophagales bacterium]